MLAPRRLALISTTSLLLALSVGPGSVASVTDENLSSADPVGEVGAHHMEKQVPYLTAADSLHHGIDSHGALGQLGGPISAPPDDTRSGAVPQTITVSWAGEQPDWLRPLVQDVARTSGLTVTIVPVRHTHARMMELGAELHSHLPLDRQDRVRTSIRADKLVLVGGDLPDLAPGFDLANVSEPWRSLATAITRFRSELGIEVEVDEAAEGGVNRPLGRSTEADNFTGGSKQFTSTP